MSEFTEARVQKKANVYHNGKVTSRTIFLADGSKKTLGIMLPGEYEFSTGCAEEMEIIAGDLEVELPGSGWQVFKAGDSFYVPANAKFSLKIKSITDYCCSYLA
jgi:uncharacterized protein YaiE (UPF0345 family)